MKRGLGFWDVYSIAAGAMISSGLFILPGLAYQMAGPAVVVAYALAAIMMTPTVLSGCELATAMPKSGGSYFIIERSLGTYPGTLAGAAMWLSLSLKSAFAMVGIGAFAKLLLPNLDLDPIGWEWLIKGIAITFCITFTLVNLWSVKHAGRLQVVLVLGLLAALGVFLVFSLPSVQQHPNFDHFFQNGFDGLLATAGMVFISFGGLTKAADVAEEVRHPGRTVPRAILTAFVTVSILYILCVTTVVGTIGSELSNGTSVNMTPLSTVAKMTMGTTGMILLSAAAMAAFITTGNAGIMAASRTPMAMSHDGLLPAGLGKIHPKFQTPVRAVLLTGASMILMISLLSIADLVKLASTLMIAVFLLINVSVLIMRSSGIQNYRPLFRSPLYPWMQIAGVGIYSVLLIQMAKLLVPASWITLGVLVVLLTGWYLGYVRKRVNRASGLALLVHRLAETSFEQPSLETELKHLAIERDDIRHDRLDEILLGCSVLDLTGHVSAKMLFERASEMLSDRMELSADELCQAFEHREAQSSTVLQPGLAIPHAIIPGKGRFDLVVVRCKDGIVFDPEQPYVKTAFLMVGSLDERNFHLKVLMAIAQMVEEKGFFTRWFAAEREEQLRDILLLSSRHRQLC